MHSIIQNFEVKIYVVQKFKIHQIKNQSDVFRIICDPSSGSIELYLTEVTRSGSQLFVVCWSVFGSVTLWVRIPPGAWLFVVSVLWCQVDVSATDWSLVQRSPTDCGASLCVIAKPRKRGGWSPLPGCENTTTMGCNTKKTNNNSSSWHCF